VHQREVRLLDAPRLELRHQVRLRRIVLRDHDEAARVAVEPVHDARPGHAADATQLVLAEVSEERVDERAAVVARRRVDHEPGRLVDDHEIVVLVDDAERDVLGADGERGDRRHVELQRHARLEHAVRLDRRAVQRQAPLGDEALDVRPGEARRIGDEAIGTRTGGGVRDLDADLPGRHRAHRVAGSDPAGDVPVADGAPADVVERSERPVPRSSANGRR
jgi:hypothetical protein